MAVGNSLAAKSQKSAEQKVEFEVAGEKVVRIVSPCRRS